MGQVCDLTAKRGIQIYYETSGPTGKPWQGDKERLLFLLMGSAADLRKTTDQQYVNLGVQFFKILTFDHRNTGRTTVKDEPCTMEDYADDAAALLEAVVPDQLPVYVLGVSFGGMVAQHMALRHPHLIKKLVLACCPTGGEGGMSYPIHEWYAPDVSMEDRVVKKIFQANTDRTPQWKEKRASEWQMVYSLLTRDEGVGAKEPLRMEGVARQLEARKAHDTWDRIGQLEMDVLVCGSKKDNITPPKLLETLAERIGSNCELNIAFDWGHPFIAADPAAFPWVNEWLRRAPKGTAQVWKVVGGADKGGILVRSGADTTSPQAAERLSTDALIEEVELRGERLNYKLLTGTGPAEGWVSVKLKDKDLVVRTEEKP